MQPAGCLRATAPAKERLGPLHLTNRPCPVSHAARRLLVIKAYRAYL